MIRAAAIAVLILASVPARAATSAAADDAFRDAKTAYAQADSLATTVSRGLIPAVTTLLPTSPAGA